MKKMNICSICNENILAEQARYAFPALPAWHQYAKYQGTLHIDCLKSLADIENIRRTLLEIFNDFYHIKSASPITVNENGVLIKDDRRQSACLDVYDFNNFAVFYVPINSIEAINRLAPGEQMTLGTQQLQILHRDTDGELILEIVKPHFMVKLDGLSHTNLMKYLLKANAIPIG